MTVRPAAADDASRCAQVSDTRSAEELKAHLGQPDVRWLVIEDDTGRVVGIGIIHLWRWNGVAWTWDLQVGEQERRKGYGTALLKGMIDAAREMGAKVLMDFSDSRPSDLILLYLKNGFRICGTNDRMFPREKDPTGVYYGYDL